MATRHGLQMRGRVDEHPVAHVEAAHVEAADVGLELDHMAHPVFRRPQRAVGAGFRRVVVVVLEACARAGREVDQHVGAACPDALHHFAIERAVHARLGGLGIAHMNVHDGGAGLGGVDRGVRDLLRRHRHGRVAAGRVGRAGDRARDHDLALHIASLRPHGLDFAGKPTVSAGRLPRGSEAAMTAERARTARCASALYTGPGWNLAADLHLIVHCAKPALIPSLERIRTVTRAIS